ncbi:MULTISPECIES: hypothetical protein [Priestia]|uniref:hypothetical protein n=1 Tax=Priestia TaxID=2800373 RepID=UPI001C8DC2B6|nr:MULTISPECIES: hypothetical protein [Priestia]MBY0062554.1 hypothetical protein [Priestia aryabhattai]WKU20948.1 hypothetical protein Q3A90_14250 [Priestia megaterium]
MIGVQGADSCGESGIGETPQERKRRGGSAAGRPRKAKPCTEINRGVASSQAH